MSHGTSLRRYALTRLALAIPTVLILLTMVFLLMRVAPGDPIQSALGGRLSQEELDQRRAAAGFDKPILEQYVEYLGDVATLDLGTTLTDNRTVTSIIVDNGTATIELTFWAFMVTLVVGISIGLLAGRFRDGPIDFSGRMFGIVIYAAPVFSRRPRPARIDRPAVRRMRRRKSVPADADRPHPGNDDRAQPAPRTGV
jgi:peptide/nickel transport system permease protein